MRRCVWSRILKDEEPMARVGPKRHREKKKNIYIYIMACEYKSAISTDIINTTKDKL